MAPVNRKQPFELLYLTYVFLVFLFWMPYWVLTSLLPSMRPRSSWTFRETVTARANKYMFFGVCLPDGYQLDAFAVTDIPEQKTLKRSKVVVIPPAKEKYLKGMATIDPSVVPVSIPGYFYRKEMNRTKALPGEKVSMVAHGGGCFALPCSCILDPQVYETLRYSKTDKVFTFEYRLAPQAPWPAPLLDGISAYTYLIDDCGFEPQNIMIGGDSAGAHLILALTRYIRDEMTLPMARCLLLHSPWSDLTVDALPVDSDTLDLTVGGPIVRKMFAANGTIRHVSNRPSVTPLMDFTSPYLSPAFADSPIGSFTGFPTTLLTYGDAESLVPEIMRLKQNMERDGVDLSAVTAPDGVHDFVIMTFWNAEKRRDAWVEIGKWVDKTLVGTQ
ncbi:hypothetical protein JAAARDRAFT_211063 [Jaapia argillacea MUCL 33604]|uniref:Alpha/beta hydrolase fold-3 domain-containing protein n=1 Tax=Jaapia argillacea MUCL 33604 TaxID=933084 RepID=A0A067PM87_9AGAM|nr:hypothetical protein JAAARDRAFT_211063 [Jaapia argillacea MUCL 33604]